MDRSFYKTWDSEDAQTFGQGLVWFLMLLVAGVAAFFLYRWNQGRRRREAAGVALDYSVFALRGLVIVPLLALVVYLVISGSHAGMGTGEGNSAGAGGGWPPVCNDYGSRVGGSPRNGQLRPGGGPPCPPPLPKPFPYQGGPVAYWAPPAGPDVKAPACLPPCNQYPPKVGVPSPVPPCSEVCPSCPPTCRPPCPPPYVRKL